MQWRIELAGEGGYVIGVACACRGTRANVSMAASVNKLLKYGGSGIYAAINVYVSSGIETGVY